MSIPQRLLRGRRRRRRRGAGDNFRSITLPLARPATFTVILLSLIGGLRSFDLIWTMTGGGPGFSSDAIASIIYKQYQAGFYGLATAGNVVLFLLVTRDRLPAVPLLQLAGGGTVRAFAAPACESRRRPASSVVVFIVPFVVHVPHRGEEPRTDAADLDFSWPKHCQLVQNFMDVVEANDYSWSPRSTTAPS